MHNRKIDIFKIDEGRLGIININNMIPIPNNCTKELLPLISDSKYKELIINQIDYINNHKKELLDKVIFYYKLYINNHLNEKQKNVYCDFKMLEEKCCLYQILQEITS